MHLDRRSNEYPYFHYVYHCMLFFRFIMPSRCSLFTLTLFVWFAFCSLGGCDASVLFLFKIFASHPFDRIHNNLDLEMK